jgi:hypothetical protein
MAPGAPYSIRGHVVRAALVPGGVRVVSKGLRRCVGTLPFSGYSAYLSRFRRADERTRTAFLLITSDPSRVAGGCTGMQMPHI